MTDEFPYFYNQDFDKDTNKKVNMEIMKYAGMYILKKMDIPPSEGGHIFSVPLEGLDVHLEAILDDIMFHNLIEIDSNSTCYKITDDGKEYINKLLDEIEGYIEKYQDFEPVTRVNLMKRDRVNPLRARFLWGLYDGEFDDFNQWQENWQIAENEKINDWREIITTKEFYDMLFEDINHMEAFDDDALDEVLRQAENDRKKDMPEVQITRVEGNTSPASSNQDVVVTREYYYNDPYYFNPIYDPLFWYIVF
ncbi:MAG: hypothetical protein OEV44_02350 [Spirochaetota bacterium]|nr:hypothetical protein [Spirochaetota bacterium]